MQPENRPQPPPSPAKTAPVVTSKNAFDDDDEDEEPVKKSVPLPAPTPQSAPHVESKRKEVPVTTNGLQQNLGSLSIANKRCFLSSFFLFLSFNYLFFLRLSAQAMTVS